MLSLEAWKFSVTSDKIHPFLLVTSHFPHWPFLVSILPTQMASRALPAFYPHLLGISLSRTSCNFRHGKFVWLCFASYKSDFSSTDSRKDPEFRLLLCEPAFLLPSMVYESKPYTEGSRGIVSCQTLFFAGPWSLTLEARTAMILRQLAKREGENKASELGILSLDPTI